MLAVIAIYVDWNGFERPFKTEEEEMLPQPILHCVKIKLTCAKQLHIQANRGAECRSAPPTP